MPKETKLYDILNVTPSAGESEIRKVSYIKAYVLISMIERFILFEW